MTPFWFGIFWYLSVVMMNIVKGKFEFLEHFTTVTVIINSDTKQDILVN